MTEQVTKTLKINLHEAQSLYKELLSDGTQKLVDNNQYLVWKLLYKNITILLYKSGKLVLQGKDESVIDEIVSKISSLESVSTSEREELRHDLVGKEEFDATCASKIKLSKCGLTEKGIADFPDNDVEPDYEYIGCDEAGKGEFLGPLVLGVAYVPKFKADAVRALGVDDSKKLSDSTVLSIATKLEKIIDFKIRIINPIELSELWRKIGNLSKIMVEEYAGTIVELLQGIEYKGKMKLKTVIVDKFSKIEGRFEKEFMKIPELKDFQVSQFEKGERYLNVAAASILARAKYLNSLYDLEKKYNMRLLRGYDGIENFAHQFIKEFGIDEFDSIAKKFFKTYKKITDTL